MDALIDRLRAYLTAVLSDALGGASFVPMAVTVVLLLVGLFLIVRGGDIFVDAATWIAEVSGIPKFIIGATVVSVATTLPELLTSAFAAAKGSTDMAIGNAVGSVTANIGLIMAISLLAMPSVIQRKDYYGKVALMLGSALVIVVAGFGGQVGLPACVILAVFFVVNVWDNIRAAKKASLQREGTDEEKPAHDFRSVTVNILKFVFGAAGIVVGASMLVSNGSALAVSLGVSERIISVTLIAIGTSLPELVTTVTAVIKKQSDLSVGNIIGANIIDLALILPVCFFIAGKGLPVTNQISSVDLPAALVVGAVACIPTIITGKFRRWQGVALILLYAVYMVITVTM